MTHRDVKRGSADAKAAAKKLADQAREAAAAVVDGGREVARRAFEQIKAARKQAEKKTA